MTLFERIQNTAKKRGMSLRELNNRAGLGTNAIYRWKKSKPAADKLQAVADVLHVSVDYLLGNEKSESVPQNIDLKQAMREDKALAWDGKPIPPEEMEIIRRILDGGK